MALPTPPNNTNPIPNNTFYSSQSWNLAAPQGPLIVGDGLEVLAEEGKVIAIPQAVGVNSILAGVGISVDQPDGDVTITNTGVTTIQAGPNIQVSANTGTVVVEALIPQSVTQVLGTLPVRVTGTTSPVVSVDAASVAASGIVQLYNNVNLDSEDFALTASVGKYLQDQISALVLSSSNLLFAGTLNANTGLLTAVTPEGTNEGFAVGSPLPAPVLTNTGYFVITTVAGIFTPTGGTTPVDATKGDWFVSSGSSWDFLDVGFDAQYGSTTQAGIVKLATDQETQDGITGTVVATPRGIQSKVSDSTVLASSTSIASSLAVKNTYDLADAAIPKSFLTTKGAILSTSTPGQPFTVVPVQDGYYLQSDIASPGGVKWAPTGTVCTVSTGTGLTGGPITTTGTIALAPSGVSPAIYSYPASLNVDSYGRIVNAVGGKDPVTTDNFTALGSIVAGTGANTFGTLLSGSNNQILAVDTGCPTGLKWVPRCVGTVTTVNTGVGLTGGPVTSIGTICLADTDVIPGSYPNACICVDQQGRITSIAQGGVGITTLFTGPGLIGGPITSSGTIDLSNTTVTPGTYNNATVTVDAKGRITSAANGSAAIPAIPCSCLTLPGEILTADAGGAPTALPVGTDGYILTANSNCALGVQWAAPAQAPPGVWQESALNMNDLVWTSCSIISGDPNQNPTFDNTVCCNVVCYRQLNTNVWEVAWKVSKFVTGGTTCGVGQYLYRLPPEVPLIDTSGCFQKPITAFCGISGSGSDNTYCYVSDVNIQGWVRRADNCNATLLASVWDNCHFRVAAGASVAPMFTNSSWYAFAGATTFISSYRITYQSV